MNKATKTSISARVALPMKHPLRSAMWIWPNNHYLYNHFAQFRRDFELKRVPPRAPLFITADKSYKVFVNGRYVCRGPARGHQATWPYDEVNLAGFLRRGHNWISVEAYNPGISNYQYSHQSCAGFLCAAEWKGFCLVSNGSWLMRRSVAHHPLTARLSHQMGFQEHVDLRLDDRKWIMAATPPKWKTPSDLEAVPLSPLSLPFDGGPYRSLQKRGIPLLREELVSPTRVCWHIMGRNAQGYERWMNISWGWIREVEQGSRACATNVITWRPQGTSWQLLLPPTGQGRFRVVSLEMPYYVVGNVAFEAQGARGGEMLDFHYQEGLVEGKPDLKPPGSCCEIALAGRAWLAKGSCRHEFHEPMGFRILTVVARNLTRPLRLCLTVRNMGYPFTMRGGFTCSDQTLNEIHAICRRTQQICALDSYVDTPWREQGQWWGDARIQARNTFYLDGDPRLLKRGIRCLAGQKTPEGLTFGLAPTKSFGPVLPDFSLVWIMTIWDYYWQTGDLDLFEEQLPRIEEVLAYFDSPPARFRNGLLRHDRRLWFFGDWSTLFKGEVPTYLNLWYLLALGFLVRLGQAANRARNATDWRRRYRQHQRLVRAHLLERRTGLMINGLNEQGRRVPSASVHDQVLALILGLAPECHDRMIRKCVLPFLQGKSVKWAQPSAYWCAYVFEEMAQRGYGAEVIRFIRRRWQPMIATGTTWENFEWGGATGWSASHAWSAHPCYHMVNILAGITQTAPAWKAIRLAPCFAAEVNSVRARIPSPQGDIAASWQRTGAKVQVELKLPAGVTAEVDLPGRKERIAGPTAFHADLKEAIVSLD